MTWIDITLAALMTLPIVATMVLGFFLLKSRRSAMGRPTIHPFFFYTGKFLLFTVFAVFWLMTLFPSYRTLIPGMLTEKISDSQKLLSALLLIAANLLIIPAYVSMGLFTRVGLPTEEHQLQKGGIYRISRNPMYFSFVFLNTAALLYIPNLILAIVMVYGMIVHHFIIQSEERYLKSAFGKEYEEYKSRVRRYI